MNFSRAFDHMRAGRRVRRAGRTRWLFLAQGAGSEEGQVVFQEEVAEGADRPTTILGWCSTELLADDWEVESLPESVALGGGGFGFFNGAQGEVFRVTGEGEIYVRGELVENNRDVARKLLEVVFSIQGLVQDPPGPYKSRLERILDND